MGQTANPAADQAVGVPTGVRSEGVPGALIVGTIAILVVLVSLPRFRAHVLDANRDDARLALGLLSERIFAPDWQAGMAGGAAPDDLHEVILHQTQNFRCCLSFPTLSIRSLQCLYIPFRNIVHRRFIRYCFQHEFVRHLL